MTVPQVGVGTWSGVLLVWRLDQILTPRTSTWQRQGHFVGEPRPFEPGVSLRRGDSASGAVRLCRPRRPPRKVDVMIAAVERTTK